MKDSRFTWRSLDAEEKDRYWNRFDAQFRFNAGTQPRAILEPTPSLTWDTSPAFHDPDPLMSNTNRVVNLAFLRAFRACKHPTLIVLDWQHPCFEFDIHAADAEDEPSEWPIPIIANGDYYIFLSPDFDYG